MQSTLNKANSLNEWQTIETFTLNNPQFSHNQMLWLLRNRKTNGLSKVVRKIGKLIYIHNDLFAEWMISYEEEVA